MTSKINTAAAENQCARNAHLAALLAGCEQGRETDFEALYTECSPQLYGALLRMLKNPALAEEALQDAFVKIWQKAGSYVPQTGAPLTWMYSIARHQALDLLRRRSSREALENTDEHGLISATPDESKTLQAMTEDADLLINCLEKLNPGARDCLVSAYCEGYSHEELSERHDTPVSTIKSWIRRGLISLKACIDELT